MKDDSPGGANLDETGLAAHDQSMNEMENARGGGNQNSWMKYATQNAQGTSYTGFDPHGGAHNLTHDPCTDVSNSSFRKTAPKDLNFVKGKVRIFNMLSCFSDCLPVFRVPVLASLRRSRQNVLLQPRALDLRLRRARREGRSSTILTRAMMIGGLFPRSHSPSDPLAGIRRRKRRGVLWHWAMTPIPWS